MYFSFFFAAVHNLLAPLSSPNHLSSASPMAGGALLSWRDIVLNSLPTTATLFSPTAHRFSNASVTPLGKWNLSDEIGLVDSPAAQLTLSFNSIPNVSVPKRHSSSSVFTFERVLASPSRDLAGLSLATTSVPNLIIEQTQSVVSSKSSSWSSGVNVDPIVVKSDSDPLHSPTVDLAFTPRRSPFRLNNAALIASPAISTSSSGSGGSDGVKSRRRHAMQPPVSPTTLLRNMFLSISSPPPVVLSYVPATTITTSPPLVPSRSKTLGGSGKSCVMGGSGKSLGGSVMDVGRPSSALASTLVSPPPSASYVRTHSAARVRRGGARSPNSFGVRALCAAGVKSKSSLLIPITNIDVPTLPVAPLSTRSLLMQRLVYRFDLNVGLFQLSHGV